MQYNATPPPATRSSPSSSSLQFRGSPSPSVGTLSLRAGYVSIKDGLVFWSKKWMMLEDQILSFRKSEVRTRKQSWCQSVRWAGSSFVEKTSERGPGGGRSSS